MIYHRQSLEISKEIGHLEGEASSLGSLGILYINRGDFLQAIDYINQSLKLAREIGNRISEGISLGNLGVAHEMLGEYEQAINFYQQYRTIASEIMYRPGEATALNNLGSLYLYLGQASEAESFFWQSIIILEDFRRGELLDFLKVGLFETQIHTYKGLEQSQILQDKIKAALETSELGRARAFVDLLTERISHQQARVISAESPNFSKIQQIARNQQSVLVEYSIVNFGPESPAIYIWVVQSTGQLDFRKVSLKDESLDLSSLVTSSREAIGVRQRGGFELAANLSTEADQLRKLHQLLIKPIADLLPSSPEQRVVFIPQGDLFLVPFPALIDEAGTYLIEKHPILTAPSIQVLDLSQQQRQTQNFATALTGQDLLLVGNPTMPQVWNPATSKMQTLSDLPGAELEAEEIATFFNTTALLGKNATETAVKAQIGNARIIHLATHGLLEYGNPQDSGVRDIPGAIALAPSDGEDGLLTSAEILAEIDLNAELVVLSACDTGLGQITGDGVIGLSRALITAGTPSVIVSLWSVPDAPTAELMTEFYRQMQQGQDKAQALRQAMLVTMKTNPDPRDWAAFTLIGAAE